ncbi:hypothetical protein CBR_g7939 [Chara braunii]|uniref:Reverse transcriptase domain-containing protein n=1 Tax=Chara braunii TaxID=69332 RepID=A0A388KKT1_CHABU|nr:hypothetical protein CBR_g7939 [Chara braunii]|eukprot:GBG70637.1 hypothetical protein CBR_g7939 [Chara braunii]
MISYLAVNHVLRDWLINTLQREEKAIVGGKPCKVLYKPWATPAEQAKARDDLQAQRFWIRVLRVPFLAMPFLEAAVKKEYGQVQKAYPPERNQAAPCLVNHRFDLHPRAKSEVTKYLKSRSRQGWHNVEVVTQDSPWCRDCRWYGHKTGEAACPKKGIAQPVSASIVSTTSIPTSSGTKVTQPLNVPPLNTSSSLGAANIQPPGFVSASLGTAMTQSPGSVSPKASGVQTTSALSDGLQPSEPQGGLSLTASLFAQPVPSQELQGAALGTGLLSTGPTTSTIVTTTKEMRGTDLIGTSTSTDKYQLMGGLEIRMTQQKEAVHRKKILSGGPKTMGYKPYQRQPQSRKAANKSVTWAELADEDVPFTEAEPLSDEDDQGQQDQLRADVYPGSIQDAIAAGRPWVVVPLVFLAVDGDLQLMAALSSEGSLSIPHFETHVEATLESVLTETQKWLLPAYKLRPYPTMEWVRLTPTNDKGRTDILCFPMLDAIINPAAKGTPPLTGLRWISLQLFKNPGGQTAVDTKTILAIKHPFDDAAPLAVETHAIVTNISPFYENLLTSQSQYTKHQLLQQFHEDVWSKVDKTLLECQLPQLESDITMQELTHAVSSLARHKAPGLDSLPAEFFRNFSLHLLPELLLICQAVWNGASLPEAALQGVITFVFKKGDRTDIANYRPISLMPALYKIFSNILTARLQKVLPLLIHRTQSGFLQGRQILHNVMVAEQLVELVAAGEESLAIILLDLAKAYDRVG